jgi:Pyruvate/2-oxoacid:ferredoxin oxidoreductase gamma subunit
MIGAFTRMLEMPPLELIFKAIEEDITVKPQQNMMASKDAFERVQLIGMIN